MSGFALSQTNDSHSLTNAQSILPRIFPLVAMLKLVRLGSRGHTSWIIICLWQTYLCGECDPRSPFGPPILLKSLNSACRSSGHHWDCHPGIISSNYVTATYVLYFHFKGIYPLRLPALPMSYWVVSEEEHLQWSPGDMLVMIQEFSVSSLLICHTFDLPKRHYFLYIFHK